LDIGPGTSDKIVISGIGFYGYHGVRDEEQTLGQRLRWMWEVWVRTVAVEIHRRRQG
jgi:dihydroneopterin aldolase